MTVMYLFLSAILIVLFLRVYKNAIPQKTKQLLDGVAIVFMAASAFLLALPLDFSGSVTTFIGSTLGGLGVAWTYMRWGDFYSKLDIYYATPLIFLSMAIGSVGKTVVDLLPPLPATVILMAMPFLAYVTLYRSLNTTPKAPEPARYYNKRTVGSLWRLALGVGVFSFTIGIIQSMPAAVESSPYPLFVLAKHGGEIVIALALVWWVVFLKRGISFGRTWSVVLLLMATALIFAAPLEAIIGDYLFALVGVAQTIIIILLYLALADIARHSSFNPMAVFTIGWTAYVLPFCLGDAVGLWSQTLAGDATILTAVIVWILVVVTLYFLDESSVGRHLIFTELNDGGEEDTPAKRIGAVQETLNEQAAADVIALRCNILTKRHNLTPREHEILELLARGRTKAYIADAFFISENTVRGHVKRLYAKLDVHNKQELVDRVESTEIA